MSTMTRADLESMFLDGEKLYKMIDELVWKDDISYLDATMTSCDELGIDPEDLVRLKLVSPILKSKLEEEAQDSGLLKPQARLPI